MSKPPCVFYKKGLCSKGKYCEFSHVESTKVPVCRWFTSPQGCQRGSACAYQHSRIERKEEKSKNGTSSSSSLKCPPAASASLVSRAVFAVSSGSGIVANTCGFKYRVLLGRNR